MKNIILALIFCVSGLSGWAQIIHSHNDYRQQRPFHAALEAGAGSIEADVFFNNGAIVVCHDRAEVETAPTFEQLYIKPMQELVTAGRKLNFIMLIDFKTSASTTMIPFVELLKKYPEIFKADGVRVVISGSRPAKEDYVKYPDFVMFDGLFKQKYTPEQLAKVAMFSGAPNEFITWNGKGMMNSGDQKIMQNIIQSAHKQGKPVRFWGAPDGEDMWLMMYHMGVDYINTDRLAECRKYFNNLTRKGFVLKEKQPTYSPTYKSDGKQAKPKNIILIIGDGMSLAQITAAETANRGDLTLMNMRHIGFQKSYALNSYNTDSAAAGTALATGHKTDNRRIATLPGGETVPNSSEIFGDMGIRVGLISSGDITDATPAAHYAHSPERDNSEDIAAFVTNGKLSLLAGGNARPFVKREDKRNLCTELSAMGYDVIGSYDSINIVKSNKVVCLDERFDKFVNDKNIDYLGKVTVDAVKKLENSKGFFLMVESARIDHSGHSNYLPGVVMETLCLDAVVSEALKYADKNGETLVIVTGDHETGGLVLLNGSRDNGSVNAHFVLGNHTGLMIPVFAYGVGAQNFNGVYENTEVFNKIKVLLTKTKK